MPSPHGLKPLIIDANLAVYVLTAAISSYAEVQSFLERQIEAGRPWFAPHLWRLEVVSTLHKLRRAGYLHENLLESNDALVNEYTSRPGLAAEAVSEISRLSLPEGNDRWIGNGGL